MKRLRDVLKQEVSFNKQKFNNENNNHKDNTDVEINKYILKQEHKGYMGFSHWLQGNALFMLLWLIPPSVPFLGTFAAQYLTQIESSYAFLILNFMVIGGAVLMPDLDSSPLEEGNSSAVSELGLLGLAISTIEITIAHVVWSIFHLKGDKKPKSGHRLLWHTFLIPISFYFWVIFTFPKSNATMSEILSKNGILNNLSAFMVMFIIAIAVYIGINVATYRLFQLIDKKRYQSIAGYVGFAIALIMMFTMSYTQLRLLGLTVALGYAFHILGDLTTQGGSPALFPIPFPENGKLVLWKRSFLPYHLSVQTGGMVNKILDYVFIAIDIILFYTIFIVK